ncbi:MAG: WD40 repeat domain-containing protein, partial [Pseudomonadota bacterium]|nr:WD40 repeat domain-containing protein [Pseudomonadota bacterium]
MNNLEMGVRGIILFISLSGCLTQQDQLGYPTNSKLTNHSISSSQTQEGALKYLPIPSGHSVKELHFIWDNQHVLAIQRFHGAFLFDLSTEEEVPHNYFLDEEVASAQLFNQNHYLLLQGGGTGVIWDLTTEKRVFNWHDPDTKTLATTVSQPGQYVFTGQYLYRFDTGKRVFSIQPQYHAVLTAAAIAPDETVLATGGTWDDQVILWDINSGKQLDLWSMSDHVKTLAFSVDNRYLYATSYRHWVAYEWATQTRVFENANPFSWWGGYYLPARDAMLIVSASGVVQWLQAPEGKVVWRYHAGEDIIAYNAEPQADLALALKNGAIALVDMNTGNE